MAVSRRRSSRKRCSASPKHSRPDNQSASINCTCSRRALESGRVRAVSGRPALPLRLQYAGSTAGRTSGTTQIHDGAPFRRIWKDEEHPHPRRPAEPDRRRYAGRQSGPGIWSGLAEGRRRRSAEHSSTRWRSRRCREPGTAAGSADAALQREHEQHADGPGQNPGSDGTN